MREYDFIEGDGGSASIRRHPRPKGKGWGTIRDWSLALLLVVGFSFGGGFGYANAGPPGGLCAPIDSWANTYNDLKAKGLVPFAYFKSDNALVVTLTHPTTQEWVLFSFHGRTVKAGPTQYCLRVTGEAAANPSYNVGELPDELVAFMNGSGA